MSLGISSELGEKTSLISWFGNLLIYRPFTIFVHVLLIMIEFMYSNYIDSVQVGICSIYIGIDRVVS